MKATEFSLPDQNGEFQKLAYYKGKWVVLYFYPADDTPGCTVEACSFRDQFDELVEDVVVLGVSKDSVVVHKKFAAKYHLTFPILSDESMEVAKAYGAFSERQFMGRPGVLRKTFLINPEGEIVKTYQKVNPLTHAATILKDLREVSA